MTDAATKAAIQAFTGAFENVVGWQVSLFGCLVSPGTCCLSFCCPCIQYGLNAEKGSNIQAGLGCCFYCLCCMGTFGMGGLAVSGRNRNRVRNAYDVGQSDTCVGKVLGAALDYITHIFCHCCALAQEAREIAERDRLAKEMFESEEVIETAAVKKLNKQKSVNPNQVAPAPAPVGAPVAQVMADSHKGQTFILAENLEETVEPEESQNWIQMCDHTFKECYNNAQCGKIAKACCWDCITVCAWMCRCNDRPPALDSEEKEHVKLIQGAITLANNKVRSKRCSKDIFVFDESDKLVKSGAWKASVQPSFLIDFLNELENNTRENSVSQLREHNIDDDLDSFLEIYRRHYPFASESWAYDNEPGQWSKGKFIERSTLPVAQPAEGEEATEDPALAKYDVLYKYVDLLVNPTNPQRLVDTMNVIVFLDLYRLQDWCVHGRIDKDMNALVWDCIFEHHQAKRPWKELEQKGIKVCQLDEIDKNSAFISHRWDGRHGINTMSISYAQAYLLHCLNNQDYYTEENNGKGNTPMWIWLDFLSVPQEVVYAEKNGLSKNEIQARFLFNRRYMGYICHLFGDVSAKCNYFVVHMPLVCVIKESTDPAEQKRLNSIKTRIQNWFAGWGMPTTYFLFSEDEVEKLGYKRIRVVDDDEAIQFYGDTSYFARIWCIAEFALRCIEREDKLMCSYAWWAELLSLIYIPSTKSKEDAKQMNIGQKFFQYASEYQGKHVFATLTSSYAAWQPNAKVAEAKTSKEKNCQAICLHFLSFEGMIRTVATATATQSDDVINVITTLYSEVSERVFPGITPGTVPGPVLAMVKWVIRNGLHGEELGKSKKLRDFHSAFCNTTRDFMYAFHPKGYFVDYLAYVSRYIRLGGNSLWALELMLTWRSILDEDRHFLYNSKEIRPYQVTIVPDIKSAGRGQSLDEVVAEQRKKDEAEAKGEKYIVEEVDDPNKPWLLPVALKPNYAFATVAMQWMQTVLCLKHNPAYYFFDVSTAKGLLDYVPVTHTGEAIVKYIVSPPTAPEMQFGVVRKSGYRLLFPVTEYKTFKNEQKASRLNSFLTDISYHHTVVLSIDSSGRCVIPSKFVRFISSNKLSESNQHSSIELGPEASKGSCACLSTSDDVDLETCWGTLYEPLVIGAVNVGEKIPRVKFELQAGHHTVAKEKAEKNDENEE